MASKPNLGITIGDFNGVGPELILRAFSNKGAFNHCTPVVYGNRYVLNFYADLLEIPRPDVNRVKNSSDIKPGVINLRKCSLEKLEIQPGVSDSSAGKFAHDALRLACEDLREGFIENLVTCPINKNNISSPEFPFPGHTEFLATEFNSDVQMFLIINDLRVTMVTGHISLSSVSASLSIEKIHHKLKETAENLRSDFGISNPKIAVLGLNPHAGDDGTLGSEENDIILPAIKAAQHDNILAFGPYPADGFFGGKSEESFDCVLGMYHDQVLIPFKQNAFTDGVNYTAGLPFVRSSPDHGTAYDITGKGIADLTSFVNAIFVIPPILRNRKNFYDKSNVPLPFREHRREKFSIGVPDLK